MNRVLGEWLGEWLGDRVLVGSDWAIMFWVIGWAIVFWVIGWAIALLYPSNNLTNILRRSTSRQHRPNQ